MAKSRNISLKPAPAPTGWRLRFKLRPRVWLSLLFLLGLGIAAHFLWQRGSSIIARNPRYQLAAEAIHLTPPPAWIRSDIKADVIRGGGLNHLSVLQHDEEFFQKVKAAFERHPWVASVERTAIRQPATLEVDLKYRRPIAAVETSADGNVAFLPIDRHAIRLSEADLTEAERRRLPRITGIPGRPPLGRVWDDPRVVGGAKLVAALADVWQQLRLVEILAAPRTPKSKPPSYTFDIITTGGTRIVWGAEPGEETACAEAPFNQKRQRLLDYAAQHGRLESIDGPALIDLRQELVVTPK